MTLSRNLEPEEIWVKVSWADNMYEVSNLGRVRSLGWTIMDSMGRRYDRPGSLIRTRPTKGGYILVTLRVNKTSKTVLLHRLVHEFHVGPLIDGLDVAHLDGDCTNNRSDNLLQCTRLENARHKARHGTLLFGDSAPNALLTSGEVSAIRSAHREGETYKSLAGRYGVSTHNIASICLRKTWRSVA